MFYFLKLSLRNRYLFSTSFSRLAVASKEQLFPGRWVLGSSKGRRSSVVSIPIPVPPCGILLAVPGLPLPVFPMTCRLRVPALGHEVHWSLLFVWRLASATQSDSLSLSAWPPRVSVLSGSKIRTLGGGSLKTWVLDNRCQLDSVVWIWVCSSRVSRGLHLMGHLLGEGWWSEDDHSKSPYETTESWVEVLFGSDQGFCQKSCSITEAVTRIIWWVWACKIFSVPQTRFEQEGRGRRGASS